MWAKHQRMCSSFIATLQHNKAQLEFINLLVALLLFLWCTACTGAPRTQNQRQCHMCVHKHNMQQRSQTEQRQKSFQRHSNYNARMIGDKKVGSKCHTHIHAQWQLSRSVSCPPPAVITFYYPHVVKLHTDRAHLSIPACTQHCSGWH